MTQSKTAVSEGKLTPIADSALARTETFQLIAPDPQAQPRITARSGFSANKVEAYRGFSQQKGFSITVRGSGTWVEGRMTGSITTYDYQALYQIYGLERNQSAGIWCFQWKNNSRTDELRKTFERSEQMTFNYDMKFRIQGNDFGINEFVVGFTTLRIDMDGQTKFFIVPNNASAGAQLPTGGQYPGGFEPI
ncbi:hypothetical protein DIZ27_42700 [Streptomyces sp. NWU339]|uniref:hypothetical protein n=1 Tax=Streptomyces sp. NWU339 TaxID=2185284 RepID=UPI000D6735BC|nr:hypothetical protein [Streptomyces sp. NWU339]PWI04866.1 hypothetical protein DIZ27_42700 [Streptomyces sp. NWU339]